MSMEYVAISDLSTINDISQNDMLLVSRADTTTNETIITTYTQSTYTIAENISSWVHDKLFNVFNQAYNNFTSRMAENFSSHKIAVANDFTTLSTNLNNEWYELSTRMKNTCDTMDSLCVTVSTEISTFIVCAEISVTKQMEWITDNYKNLCADMLELENRMKAWANEKFVTLSGDDIISGNKTFTKDINGCALSARWI